MCSSFSHSVDWQCTILLITLPQHTSALVDDEAFVVLDVARARREVCRAEQALAKSLADEHAAVSQLYRLQAQSLGNVLHPLELDVGTVLAAMRRHGIDEQGPGFNSKRLSDPQETSSEVQIDSDGMSVKHFHPVSCRLRVGFLLSGTITKSVGDHLLHIRLD